MKISLEMVCYPQWERGDIMDWDTWVQEFELNWCCQVPHWHLWSKEGWEFFKNEKNK